MSNETPNQDQLRPVSTNVVDMQTRQTIMPQRLRSLIMGQYLESKSQDQSPEDFATSLERRILGDVAYVGAKQIQDFFQSFMEDK